MMNLRNLMISLLCLATLSSCGSKGESIENRNLTYAEQTLDSLYKYYSVADANLLRETYPFDDTHKATYLANEEQAKPNEFSYLWPYSGTFSAVNVLLEASGDQKYKNLLDQRVLPGLEQYFDQERVPYGYSSYITTLESDRFYDDNVWLGIDFADVFMQTKETKYLDKSKLIWNFVWSGSDDKLGGGIYWCEQNKHSKNTCSNAPGSVFALKLFMATEDSTYYEKGIELYDWTKKNLQDPEDKNYYDNIRLDGSVDKAKYAYNSGQMLQAATLLYNLTKDEQYLTDAKAIADGAFSYFFEDFKGIDGKSFKMIKRGDIWFTAVMLRGYVELYHVDGNKSYLEAFGESLDYAWEHARDEKGLFNVDLKGNEKDAKKWLLTQAAMIEMYARLSTLN